MVAPLCESSHGWGFLLRRLNLGVDAGQRSGDPKASGSWREIGGRECDRWPGQSEAASEARAGSWVRAIGVRRPCPPPPQDLHQLPDM